MIYKEAELRIDPTSGGTPLCPFDCDCCELLAGLPGLADGQASESPLMALGSLSLMICASWRQYMSTSSSKLWYIQSTSTPTRQEKTGHIHQ